jgi:hypothetical protein
MVRAAPAPQAGPTGPHRWTHIHVHEIRGRLASACLFDVEDEEAAFAYAEERVRRAEHR